MRTFFNCTRGLQPCLFGISTCVVNSQINNRTLQIALRHLRRVNQIAGQFVILYLPRAIWNHHRDNNRLRRVNCGSRAGERTIACRKEKRRYAQKYGAQQAGKGKPFYRHNASQNQKDIVRLNTRGRICRATAQVNGGFAGRSPCICQN